MTRMRRFALTTASALAALAIALPAAAQGKSGSAPGKNKKSTPPSSSSLPIPPSTSGATGASPMSWVDDASLLEPGSVSFTISAMRWTGADVSEVDFPIVDATFGVTKRFQLTASVPRVVGGEDGGGAVGGFGTSYFIGKIALLDDAKVKLAVSPMFEVLGQGARQALEPGESRYQVGVPVSVEVGEGAMRVFGAMGFFTRGAWFAGGGTAFQLSPRSAASFSFTRSWAKTDVAGVQRERSELSGGLSHFLTDRIAAFGSLGHTIATTDENGAGLTIGGGATFFFTPRGTK